MSNRWADIESLFDALVALPAGERGDRLAKVDPELRREVESLLAAHAAAGGFLATSAESFARPFVLEVAATEPVDLPGVVIGRYRLVRHIARGGMGSVWLAERSDGQFEHHVALKLIKRGMDSEEILARFLRERQILARLEHPHIARLLDGGVTADGRPWFAMEYVAGSSITAWCAEHGLGLEDRLRLFVSACRAVGYAHRNLVVHRDIKPSNVLVDEQGELKLLDFGIARLLGDSEEPALTAGTGRLLTPEYASPEQLAGGQVTTASDVYQLGILLHELLTGRRPSGAAPSAVDGRLRGDLDTITLRALREEPERRYPSAEDLADDVERHLTHRPIRFGGDRASYRAAKYFRRHRVGVSAAALVVVVTTGLLAFDAVRVRGERDRARHEADKAIEVTQLMAGFLQGWNPDASDRGEVSARKLLGDAAVRAERDLAGRPEMLAASLSILGDFHTTLGEWGKADSLLTRALSLQSANADGDRAATLVRQARLYRFTGRYAEAVTAVELALLYYRAELGPDHLETLRAERELGGVLRAWQKYPESERVLRHVLESLAPSDRADAPIALEASEGLGYAIYQQGRFDEAVDILRPVLARQRALFGPVHVATLTTMRSLGSALRDRGDLDEALGLYREALRVARALYGGEHLETMTAMLVLSLLLERKNEQAEAETLVREILAISDRIYSPPNPAQWGHLLHLGSIRLDRGDAAEAEQYLRQALALARQLPPGHDLGDVLNRLAWVAVRRGAPDADTLYREAVAFDAARPPGRPIFVTDGIHFLAAAEQRKGDREAALEDFRRAFRLYERQLPPDHPYLVATRKGLAELTASAQ